MHDNNNFRKSFTQLGKYLSKNDCFFWKYLPKAVFRTQPKVYGGAFLQK